MKCKIPILILPLLFIVLHSNSQEQREFSVMFYNVENLFDSVDDPSDGDDEFTPQRERHWTNKRFNEKLLNISKVIISASGFYPPDIVGLCEIENRNVLEHLIQNTPLKAYSYKIIHKESPDHRGIDVALLYNSKRIYPLDYEFLKLFQNDSIIKTREILYFAGVADRQDTLHFFINHWPSRYGGLLETRQDRTFAARMLRSKVDSLFQASRNSKIIILGDFNDQPTDVSLSNELKVREPAGGFDENQLYNLSWHWIGNEPGTLKYQSQWSVFDQIIVSGSLLMKSRGLSVKPENAKIATSSFLFENDEKFGGTKPKRTYYGYSYEGGFSDHLPVILKLFSDN